MSLPFGHIFGAFPFSVEAFPIDCDEHEHSSAATEPAPICIACGVCKSADGFLPCGHDTI